jgi:MFS family permease
VKASGDAGHRTATLAGGARFLSDVPARLDRLPWSRWHLRVVVALGVTWMLDGLEVTLVGAVGPLLAGVETLHLRDAQIGAAATAYLAGAVTGALVFGRLSDRFGRRKLFLITLVLYSTATAATAIAWSFGSFAFFRALTGAGIGGECSAVNSAIDELIPARIRGHTDLAINGTYWLGAALGALLTVLLTRPHVLAPGLAWRAAFLLGAVLQKVRVGFCYTAASSTQKPSWSTSSTQSSATLESWVASELCLPLAHRNT